MALRLRLTEFLVIGFAGTLVSLAGCGPSEMTSSTAAKEGSQFKTLVLNYIEIVRKNRGKLPKNSEAFEKEMGKVFGSYLAEHQMDLKEVLTSPRDGEPYVFVTQENKPKRENGIAGYEKIGVDGMRYVGTMAGEVIEMNEIEFQQLFPNG